MILLLFCLSSGNTWADKVKGIRTGALQQNQPLADKVIEEKQEVLTESHREDGVCQDVHLQDEGNS